LRGDEDDWENGKTKRKKQRLIEPIRGFVPFPIAFGGQSVLPLKSDRSKEGRLSLLPEKVPSFR
jgi:hypothetical protein